MKDGVELDNCDSIESEELLNVANVIDKLSVQATTVGHDKPDNNNDSDDECVRDITNNAIRKTIEENEDLKRQNILLNQQLEEKDRKIKALERLLLNEDNNNYKNSIHDRKSLINTATQVTMFIFAKLYSKHKYF